LQCVADRAVALVASEEAVEDLAAGVADGVEGSPHGQRVVEAGERGIRFLLVSGKPLQEPVAWYGPIVMNTREELEQAYRELEQGTFIQKE